MNKLREQIANAIHDWEYPDEIGIDETYWGRASMSDYLEKADAILALLQPRLLTKDEAHVANNIWKCGEYCISCDYQDDCRDLNAKLKLIQEEE